ncbi:MAG: hypothetical protein DSM106950_18045 [Stigonema ocellatum SAG 48.90 = DSM 106950]|nr:hypothetical protein [Stigonema ocellatum SAG 48.90 = DSM 106950]
MESGGKRGNGGVSSIHSGWCAARGVLLRFWQKTFLPNQALANSNNTLFVNSTARIF